VSENRVPRRIFESKEEEVTGDWRRLHSEEFYNLHASQNIIRVMTLRSMKRLGHAARWAEMRNIYKILVEKPEGRDHLEDLSLCEDNIRIDLR
jgi:hypothetical protein